MGERNVQVEETFRKLLKMYTEKKTLNHILNFNSRDRKNIHRQKH